MPSNRTIARTCEQCGRDFEARERAVKRGEGRFCGHPCASRHTRAHAKPRQPKPLAERFWSKVDRSGDCWLWLAGRTSDGYGAINGGGLAHRVAYELTFGPVPAGLCVCHHCDTPLCVRPEHLFLGTLQDNIADMMAKGRSAKGERKPFHKLTEAQVRAIRDRYAAGEATQPQLATEYGVSTQTVWGIVVRRIWKHV